MSLRRDHNLREVQRKVQVETAIRAIRHLDKVVEPRSDAPSVAKPVSVDAATSVRRAHVSRTPAFGDNCCSNARGGLDGVLVLPHANGRPPSGLEPLVSVPVPQAVPFDLGYPVVGVRRWRNIVLRARVPEAAIHEDGHMSLREDQVGPSADRGDGREVHSVPKPQGVDCAPEAHLRGGVSPSISEHDVPNGGRGRPRVGGWLLPWIRHRQKATRTAGGGEPASRSANRVHFRVTPTGTRPASEGHLRSRRGVHEWMRTAAAGNPPAARRASSAERRMRICRPTGPRRQPTTPTYRRYQCVPMVLGVVGASVRAWRRSSRRVDDGDELLDVLEQAGVGDAARSAESD